MEKKFNFILTDTKTGENVLNTRKRTYNKKHSGPVIWRYFPLETIPDAGILSYYSQFPDVYRLEHSYVKGNNLGRPAHIGYLAKGGSIEQFLINGEQLREIRAIARTSSFYVKILSGQHILNAGCDCEKVMKDFGVRIELKKKFKKLEEEIIEISCKDIFEHCEGIPYGKKVPDDWAGVFYVDEFVPKTKARIYPVKKERILQRGKGRHQDHTICDVKVATEFSLGCISSSTSNGFYNPKGPCNYCYGGGDVKKFGIKYIKTSSVENIIKAFEEPRIEKDKEKQLKLEKGKTLLWRLGIKSEPFIPEIIREKFDVPTPTYLENCLTSAIKLNNKGWDIRPLIFSKYAEFDAHINDLLIRSSSVLFASIGRDDCESGAVGWGFDTKKRLEEIVRYKEKGLENASIALVTDLTRPFSGRDESDPLDYVRNAAEKFDLNLMYMGLRIKKHVVAEKFTGMSKKALKKLYLENAGQKSEFENEKRFGYRPRSRINSSEFVCKDIHPEFINDVKEHEGKRGFCISPGDKEACCSCFTKEKFRQKFKKGKYY